MRDTYYENYRSGIISRHICSNGRFLQDVLVDRSTGEVVTLDKPQKPVGGGDNPFLYGGLLMATLAMEDIGVVSEHSHKYANLLMDGFFRARIHEFFRRAGSWWRPYKFLSKDELCGIILGLHFYIKAAKIRKRQEDITRGTQLLKSIADFLIKRNFKIAGSWVFRYPFATIFEYHLGEKYAVYAYWDKLVFKATMRFLPLVYRLASVFGMKKRFYNVAMYCHCMLMLHETSHKHNVEKDFLKLHKYFVKNDGSDNEYLKFINCLTTGVNNTVGWSVLDPEGIWSPELPANQLIGEIPPFIGECFTWEHPDSGEHNLKYSWNRVENRIGPADISKAVDDPSNYFVESCGLGLVFVRMLASHYMLCDKPVIVDDVEHSVLPYDGAL